jgi:hypothetical protein
MIVTEIWKFPLGAAYVQDIFMPEGAKILCVQVQRGIACLWVMVDTRAEKVARRIAIVDTGHSCPGDSGAYIGTFQLEDAGLVSHVFERKETTT